MKTTEQISISKAEWAVMEIVWNSSKPLISEEIIAKLAETHFWSEGTIRSLLNRLLKKNALETEREGRRFFYRAAREKSECLRQESFAFLDQYFGGKLTPMMACFLGDEKIGDDELDRLEELIKQRREERK
ncbi:MAG: BlaI/MecI/CopY family transcriptional regulator [Verrucomicrobiales bacterium]|nr:BlaI/MecI/CopY family transcriptional regulator [Verrucomicrobiales bacterium]